MAFDFNALMDINKKSKKIIYQHSPSKFADSNMNFFDLRAKEHWDGNSRTFRAAVRLVVKPGTKGFGYTLIHQRVGYPGKDPKTFVCPRFYDENADCICCEVGELVNDEECQQTMIPWHTLKNGQPVSVDKSVADIVAMISPEPRLILCVCEPQFMDDFSAREELKGVQIWFLDGKRTLIKGIMTIGEGFPKDYFTKADGTGILVSYNPTALAKEMYSIKPYTTMPIDQEVIDSAPDAEQFVSKIKSQDEMRQKLASMLPGVEI